MRRLLMFICCALDVMCCKMWLGSERSVFKPPDLFKIYIYFFFVKELLQVYFTLVKYPSASSVNNTL
jgi:hypothetical protein